MTQLYSANLQDLAKPIKKGGRKRKAEETPASPPPTESSEVAEQNENEPPVPATPAPSPTTAEPATKKPKTEKQLAALERARERRRLQKEEQERQRQEEAARQAALEEAKRIKQEAAKEKRRLAREAKLMEQGLEPIPEKGQVVKTRRSRPVYREDHEPPQWFKKYIETVKTEQSKLGAEKKAQKVIKEEAHQEAQVHWGDQPTRSRVTHEVDNHMNRMYSMIFNRR